jgi:hypothetical protein
VDSRQNRIARNEALYREVNERIRAVQAQIGDEERTDFLCECGREDCTQPIRLSLAEYEEIRSDPTHFAVARGHEVVDLEHVIRETDRFSVIEKFPGAPAQVALDRDPRADPGA